MRQKIAGFHTDDDNHWVADLECGHKQHVRHEPPLTTRPWVLTEDGRERHLGVELDCKRCDTMGLAVAEAVRGTLLKAAQSAYEDGGLQGLCHEGRVELALNALQKAELRSCVESAIAQVVLEELGAKKAAERTISGG